MRLQNKLKKSKLHASTYSHKVVFCREERTYLLVSDCIYRCGKKEF